jgi:ribosomal protein S8
LLGFKEESLTLNLLILIAKNYIYTCKCKLKEKNPNIIELKYRIKNYYSLEQYIAIKNNNLKGFEKYWIPVKHVFQIFNYE